MGLDVKKSDYSTRETLKGLSKKLPFDFVVSKKINLSCYKNQIDKGDKIIINKIHLKDKNDTKTHKVKIKVQKNKGKNFELDLSGGIFLNNFFEHLPEENIVFKNVKKVKDKVKNINS